MTDWVTWFRYQLKASADGFEWAFSTLPLAFHLQAPPDPAYLGKWSPARLVWHTTEYERCLAIPSMSLWLKGEPLPELPWPDDTRAWAKFQKQGKLDELIPAFRRIRQQQIDFLDQLQDVDWDAPRDTLWGPRSLSWVVTKTFQHTYEHGDTLLRMGLWWEVILKEMAEKTARST